MNIFEQIIHDQGQRKREPTAKMSKNEAKVLLLEGITKKDYDLVSLAVKNGARVRGAVDGHDLFVACLNNFDASIFTLLFPEKKTSANKDLAALIMDGDRNCLDYFSKDVVENLDWFNYPLRWQLARNTNTHFVNWFYDHFDECMAYAQANSSFRNTPNALSAAYSVSLTFAARMQHSMLSAHIAQKISHNQIPPTNDWEFDVFSCDLEEVSNIAKTIDALPTADKNTVHAFFNLQTHSLGGDVWMDNVLQRNPKHIETVLKSPAGCLYVENLLTDHQVAEKFLNNSIIHNSVSDHVQWQNVLRLKNVYQNWVSSQNLNIVQHLVAYMTHPVNTILERTVDDSERKLVESLLRINPDAFHTTYPQDHRLKDTTPFDNLPVELQSYVSKFGLQQQVGNTKPSKSGSGKRKI